MGGCVNFDETAHGRGIHNDGRSKYEQRAL